MSKERILSFGRSKQLSAEELQSVSAAGMTSVMTANGSYNPQAGFDSTLDLTLDL